MLWRIRAYWHWILGRYKIGKHLLFSIRYQLPGKKWQYIVIACGCNKVFWHDKRFEGSEFNFTRVSGKGEIESWSIQFSQGIPEVRKEVLGGVKEKIEIGDLSSFSDN